MRTIMIPARLPEKKDIIKQMDSLTNEEIGRFVCKFEGFDSLREFKTKRVPTQRLVDVRQMQMVRKTTKYKGEDWEEWYSCKTCAVYRVSHYDNRMFFGKIFFKENRPARIGYGLVEKQVIGYTEGKPIYENIRHDPPKKIKLVSCKEDEKPAYTVVAAAYCTKHKLQISQLPSWLGVFTATCEKCDCQGWDGKA